jgi:hypothetical protein
MNQLVPLPPKGEFFLVQPGCTGAHLQPASDGCAWVCGPASKSSARLFKLSQAAATKEKNWSRSFGSRAMGSQLIFFLGQRSSAAINGTDYRIYDPEILESSDDLETEHHHRVQNNCVHNE